MWSIVTNVHMFCKPIEYLREWHRSAHGGHSTCLLTSMWNKCSWCYIVHFLSLSLCVCRTNIKWANDIGTVFFFLSLVDGLPFKWIVFFKSISMTESIQSAFVRETCNFNCCCPFVAERQIAKFGLWFHFLSISAIFEHRFSIESSNFVFFFFNEEEKDELDCYTIG